MKLGKKEKNKPKEKEQKNIKNLTNNIDKEILNIIIIVSSLLTLISLYSESTGFVGKMIRVTVLSLFGYYGYILPYIVIVASILYMIKKLDLRNKLVSIISINLCIITVIHIVHLNNEVTGLFDTLKSSMDFGVIGEGGGIVGAILSFISLTLFGYLGAYILIFAVFIVSVSRLTNKSLFEILKRSMSQLGLFFAETITMFKVIISKNMSKKVVKRPEKETDDLDIEDSENIKEIKQIKEKKLIDLRKEKVKQEPKEKPKEELKENPVIEELKIYDYNKQKIEDLTDSRTMIIKKKPIEEKKVTTPSEVHAKDKSISSDEEDYEDYAFPPMEILKSPEKKDNKNEEEMEVKKNAEKLIQTLEDFGIEAKVSQVSIGPSITQYEIQPAPGIKVSRIVSLSNDIALSLASSDLRMEAPIPGKAAIGIEIPNKNKVSVNLREIIQSKEFEEIDTKVPMALGKDISGKPIIANIETMPHLLIAGATGSGKSVCINTLIASILYRAKPNEVKLLMIDPKMVELSVYNGIPHLLIPVVTEPKKAANALNWAVTEMNRRYQKFSDTGVRDMAGFNKKAKDDSEKMPQIVIIIDELADLMMVAASAVEDYICRLAQMARAAGIHLIVATQRPSVDIITGTIKANIPSRISFAVSSQVDSRTILDTGGAEKLLGRGDMLFHPVGASKPVRIQGAFIDDEEVEQIVEFLKQDSETQYEEEIIEEIEKQSEVSENDDVDELFDKAVELILHEGQASISLLQRKLKVGYARAARIVDEMEERGVVGGHEGSKPRRILITEDDITNE